jgi:hypothetical protein
MLEYTNTVMRLNPQQFLTGNGVFGKKSDAERTGLIGLATKT